VPDAPKLPPLKPRYTPPPRGTTAERGYGSAHKKIRARLIAEHPVCQRCGGDWSTDMHHRDGDTFNRSPANLEMVCERCHHGEIHGR
jgi:5-methylcytosine-specific restriction endonuclease McrA